MPKTVTVPGFSNSISPFAVRYFIFPGLLPFSGSITLGGGDTDRPDSEAGTPRMHRMIAFSTLTGPWPDPVPDSYLFFLDSFSSRASCMFVSDRPDSEAGGVTASRKFVRVSTRRSQRAVE